MFSCKTSMAEAKQPFGLLCIYKALFGWGMRTWYSLTISQERGLAILGSQARQGERGAFQHQLDYWTCMAGRDGSLWSFGVYEGFFVECVPRSLSLQVNCRHTKHGVSRPILVIASLQVPRSHCFFGMQANLKTSAGSAVKMKSIWAHIG